MVVFYEANPTLIHPISIFKFMLSSILKHLNVSHNKITIGKVGIVFALVPLINHIQKIKVQSINRPHI